MDMTSCSTSDPQQSVSVPNQAELLRNIGKIRYNGGLTDAGIVEIWFNQTFFKSYRHQEQAKEGQRHWENLQKHGVTELFLLCQADRGGADLPIEEQAKQVLMMERVLQQQAMDVAEVKRWYVQSKLLRTCVKQLAGLYQVCGVQDVLAHILTLQGNIARIVKHLASLEKQGRLPEDIGAMADPDKFPSLTKCWSGQERLKELPLTLASIPVRVAPSIWPNEAQEQGEGLLSPKLILAAAKLFSEERQARKLAGNMRALVGDRPTANVVDRLGELYFKSGRGSSRVGLMETLQYGIVSVLGLHERCAASKTCSLAVHSGPTPARLGSLVEAPKLLSAAWRVASQERQAELRKSWKFKPLPHAAVKSFELSKLPPIQVDPKHTSIAHESRECNVYRGSVQTALAGRLLIAASPEEKNSLQLNEVCDAVLDSIIEGCSDLTSSNAIIDTEGRLRFFDRSRDFVHGNDYLLLGESLIPAFRCALLDLAQCTENLELEQLEPMLAKLQRVKARLPKLEAYLHAPSTVCLIDQLDHGWLDPELSLAAMRQRIQRLESALKQAIAPAQTHKEASASGAARPLNLRTLAYAVFPELRMQACVHLALSLCRGIMSHSNWAMYRNMPFSLVGGMLLNSKDTLELWDFCELDFAKLREMAKTDEPDFQGVEDYVCKQIKLIKRSEGQVPPVDLSFREWIRQKEEQAQLDYKDMPPEDVRALSQKKCSDAFAALLEEDVDCYYGTEAEADAHMQEHSIHVLVHRSAQGSYYARYQLSNGHFLRRRIHYVLTQDKLRLARSLDCYSPKELATKLKEPYKEVSWSQQWERK